MTIAIKEPEIANLNIDQLESVVGAIGFVPPGGGMPLDQEVVIRDARPILHDLSLDREGFTLVRHASAAANNLDPENLQNRYADEMAAFLLERFGASWVVPMRSSVFARRARVEATQADLTSIAGVRTTAGVAHFDFSPIAGPMLAAMASQAEGVPIRSYSRLMIINTWRAISPPPQDFSLALCDSSSVLDSDVLSAEFTEPASGVRWRNGAAHYGDHQRWCYFPDMTPDELILFKGYDSEREYRVAHGAFDNRARYPNAGVRESVEGRFFVYYE